MPLAVQIVDVVSRAVTEHGLGWWLAGAGVVALYLAYRAVKLVTRVVALGVAGLTFVASGPVGDRVPDLTLPHLGDVSTAAAVEPPPDAFRAVVTSVTDGDTLRVRVSASGSSPAHAGEELELRLLRIDAPERARDGRPADCFAEEATAALTELAAPGSSVRGAYDVERRDRFDRDLVHLWDDEGTWINGALLAGGYAQVVTFPPNTALDGEVRDAEADARGARRGRWDPAAC